MINRRGFNKSLALITAGALLPLGLRAESESPLIYLSPVKSDGGLSRCQAEVWYVQDGDAMVVVTASNAWRARAVANGLQKTQVWVGDVGQWQSSDGAYKGLPALMANASIMKDGADHSRLLKTFGAKYSAEWSTWGPRFEKGLADGSRVMLRYQPA